MALSTNDDDEETQRYLYSLVIQYSIFLTLPLICIYKYLWCLSEGSFKLASDATETGRLLPYTLSKLSNTFAFKIEDKKGRMHRFTCGMLHFSAYHIWHS
jgi:hypothetical protein